MTSEFRLAFGKLGLALAIASLIVVGGIAYFFPNIEAFFNVKILMEGKPNVNIVIRLYAGFLFSSVLAFAAQFVLWLLVKLPIGFNMEQYDKYLPEAKTVRNFSAVVLLILWALASLLTGIGLPRL